jgi:hypothetical protein
VGSDVHEEKGAPFLIYTDVSNGVMATLVGKSFLVPSLVYKSGYKSQDIGQWLKQLTHLSGIEMTPYAIKGQLFWRLGL